jgi:adenosylhomocysteine nucleosidase
MNDDSDDKGISVVVLSALSVELRAVRPYLTSTRTVRHDAGTHFVVGTAGKHRRRVAATVTGEGNHSAAIIAERAIALFRPQALVLVGIAGSLRSDVRLGDVVVATRTYAYHGGRAEPDGLMSSPRCWEAPHELSQLARFVDLESSWHTGPGRGRRRAPEVHFGGIAAGEVVLDSRQSSLADHLRQHYVDAIAVEMESAGIAQAGHLNRSAPTLTIRAISDTADGTKSATDAAGWRVRAAANAAAFAVALIENL